MSKKGKTSNAKTNNRRNGSDGGTYNNKRRRRNNHSNSANNSADKFETSQGASSQEVMSGVGNENDPSWYTVQAQLVKDMIKIPFTTQLGSVVNYRDPGSLYYGDSTDPTTDETGVPGIMAFKTHIAPGYSSDPNSAMNLAAYGIFSYIRKNLSTIASYAPADVMMYIMGVDSIFTMYAWLMRIFGTVNLYSSLNYYLPDALLYANGFSDESIEDLKANYNDYRAKFNQLIYRASTIYMPTAFTLIERHSWLFSNYFIDRNSVKGQVYMHVPSVVYVLNETVSDNGTALEPFQVDKRKNMGALLNLFETMLNKYRNSDSMAKIAADMRRAFEDTAPWKLAYCDELWIVPITPSDEALIQIHNSTINMKTDAMHTATPEAGSDWIYQDVDSNSIVFTPIFKKSNMAETTVHIPAETDPFMNLITPEPTEADITVGSRGILTGAISDEGDFEPVGMASDFIETATIYNLTYYKDTRNVGIQALELPEFGVVSYTPASLDVIASWSAFDWAPALLYHNIEIEPDTIPLWHRIWEVDNITAVPKETLVRLNEAIMASMWSVPQMGTYDPRTAVSQSNKK